ncbi:MAG: O-acetylhomoserine aminocarboxypropyltransferase [Geminicoccaceae bacterium]|nr:O-acetylhomoserine aminocarboxypropyltransferase [Geminicoccaceae bacterium]
MIRPRFLHPDTLALHAGGGPDPSTGARAVPIYQTTSFCFESTDEAAALFDLETPGHIYSRISNPTVSAFEERMAALENGVAAVATASGQAALHLAIATLLGAGDRIVASRHIYGGSANLLKLTLPRFGIETRFVDVRDHEAIDRAMEGRVRLLLVETLGNPGLEVADIPALAAIAHRHDVPLLVDNTFATPCLMKPIDHGADIVMHSATKWIGGHGVAIGGVLVDGGRFDWRASGRFPTLSEPCPGYGHLVFADTFGPSAFAARARAEGLRDFGACMSPQNAFYLLQGLETLPLRMSRHVTNTDAVLDFLGQHGNVAYVLHPRREDHHDHDLARHLLPRGAGSVVSFGIVGGREAGARFIERCRLASHLANVGDARTLVIHPASTTHAQLGPEALAAAGVREDMVRISVGLEDSGDIIADLRQALDAVTGD